MSFEQAREDMVELQLRARGIEDDRVLGAMMRVPRHHFVDAALVERAYEDCALPTDAGQTISQPYIVARMTELLRLRPGTHVLEIGTGSGYQTAVLLEMGVHVHTIERLSSLANMARGRLSSLGYSTRVHWRTGDGNAGWVDAAPFDGILVTAAARQLPRPLLLQLATDGRLVLPLGEAELQGLACIRKTAQGVQMEYCGECHFVKLIGEYGWEA